MKNAKTRRKPATKSTQILHVLSDSTGNLARHMLTAFLTQFPADAFVMRLRPFLETEAKVREALAEAEQDGGIVFHAVVSPGLKKLIAQWSQEKEIPACDLTGTFVDFLAEHSGIKPSDDHKVIHHIDESYMNRIRAMEFTLEHDDGLGLDTLHKADVVLAGVSRTSKTPTSIYLAQQGYRVANVSLAMGVDPPTELLALTREKVVGLVIHPDKLADIRTKRNRGWQMGDTAYNDAGMCQEEITWSRRLFNRRGWRILDITDFAIEESAAKILEMLEIAERNAGGIK